MRIILQRVLKVSVFVVVLATSGGAAWWWYSQPSGEEAPANVPEELRRIPVVLQPSVRMPFEDVLNVAGDVQARTWALVSARLAGTLDEIWVDEGDSVVAGETRLFRLDDVKFSQALEIARQDLEVAKFSVLEREANLERLQADHDKATLDRDRFQRLYEQDGAVTLSAFEVQESRFRQTSALVAHGDALLALARAQTEQAASRLAIAKEDFADSLIIAPISGTVTERMHEPGEAAKVADPILRIEDTSTLEVSCFLPAAYYGRVEVGRTEIRAHVNGEALVGVVDYVGPTVHSKLRTFEIRVFVADPPRSMVPGSMANIEVLLERRDGLGVPEEAVLRRADGFVLFVVEDGMAREIQVTPGLLTDGWLEVVSETLAVDMPVVAMGQFLLDDGTAVLVREEE